MQRGQRTSRRAVRIDASGRRFTRKSKSTTVPQLSHAITSQWCFDVSAAATVGQLHIVPLAESLALNWRTAAKASCSAAHWARASVSGCRGFRRCARCSPLSAFLGVGRSSSGKIGNEHNSVNFSHCHPVQDSGGDQCPNGRILAVRPARARGQYGIAAPWGSQSSLSSA